MMNPEKTESEVKNTENIKEIVINRKFDRIGGRDLSYFLGTFLVGENEEAILSAAVPADEKAEVPPRCLWDPDLSFFASFDQRADALKKAVAVHLISGNAGAGIELIGRNTWLINEEIEGTVVMGERSITLKGKPLQILARLGDLNPIELEEKDEPIGGVEQLIALDLLSADEIENQFNEVFLPGWDSEDRMKPLKAAVETLVKDIAALDIDPDAPWDKMRPLAEEIIHRFRATIFNLPMPDSGFIFDRRIFPWFIDRFWGGDGQKGWKELLGNAWSTKSDLLFVAGLGSLQAADSACGLQMHRQGIYKVVAEKEAPNREVHFSAGCPDFYSHLGVSAYLSLYSGTLRRADGRGAGAGRCFQKYCQTSTAVLQKFMRTSARPKNQSRCVIL